MLSLLLTCAVVETADVVAEFNSRPANIADSLIFNPFSSGILKTTTFSYVQSYYQHMLCMYIAIPNNTIWLLNMPVYCVYYYAGI